MISFIHFNPTKQAHFGIKYYKIYESSSDYCIQFRIYNGQKVGNQSLPAHATVMELMAPYLSRYYNLYSSPTLFTKLLEADMYVVGKIWLNRQNMTEVLNK